MEFQKNIDEAISELDKNISDSVKVEIQEMSEKEFIANSHFSIGKNMRNNWNLWKDSQLTNYFKNKGINHPDDMSSIILTSYYRYVTNQEIDLQNQIKYYKTYWKNSKKVYQSAKLPPAKKQPEKNLNFGYVKLYKNRNVSSRLYFQTNSLNDSIWIYDNLYGWKKINKNLQSELQNTDKTEDLLNKIYRK